MNAFFDDESLTIDEKYALIDKINKLPTAYRCIQPSTGKKIFMSHSGATGPDTEDLIWDRTHYFYDIEPEDGYDVIIHGHTPIPYLLEDIDPVRKFYPNYQEETPLWYGNGKCDIDNLTCVSGKTILLCVDTFESFVFEVDDEEREFLYA